MSLSWQSMAQRLVPEAWEQATALAGSQGQSIYLVLSALLPIVRKAHEESDSRSLACGYAFVEWCAHQPTTDLWNAVGVAFYEHLFEQGIRPDDIVPWMTPETYAAVKGLIAWRLGDAVAQSVERAMNDRNHTHTAQLNALIKQASQP